MKQLKRAVKIFLLLTVLTGWIYPLLITTIAQVIMPFKANGSLIKIGETVIGSELIAQKTTDEKYFWPRPSAGDYNLLYPSGGSNLGPTSQKLKDLIKTRKARFGNDAPAEMIYASGSGLDPHISLRTAYFQANRIARARSIEEKTINEMIEKQAEETKRGIFGEDYVNVLLLNIALEGV